MTLLPLHMVVNWPVFTIFYYLSHAICYSYGADKKSPLLTYATTTRRPRFGVDRLEFRQDLWRQKTKVLGLSYGVICLILSLAVFVEHRNVTDGRTDARTDRHDMTASIASRG